MKIEALIMLGMFAVILYLVHRNKSFASQLEALTQGRPESGAIKYPLALPHLQQIRNEIVQAGGAERIPWAFYGMQRTLAKLCLRENFEYEILSAIKAHERKIELLERQASHAQSAGRIYDVAAELSDRSAGVEKLRKLLREWNKAKCQDFAVAECR